MKKFLVLTTLISLSIAASSSQAALLLHYTFDSETAGALADGATITNAGTSGVDGTATLSGGTLTVEIDGGVGLANYLGIQPADEAHEGVAAPHIASGTTLETLGLGGDKDYTMMAWVQFQSQTNDNMVFGGGSGDVLHLGSRGSNYWSGHWGDDVNSAGTPSTELGNWHHVTWTNTGQTQEIFVDGESAATGGDAGAGGFNANLTETLLIGSSRNQGSFKGALDDVRVYDEVLTQEQIDAIIAEATPETTELLIHYTFDSAPLGELSPGTTFFNSGTTGIDGTAGVSSGTMTVRDDIIGRPVGIDGALERYLVIAPADDADSGTDAPHISTGSALEDLGINGDSAYMMMAWVRFDNQVGDNIVFGGGSGAALQLGSRADDLLSGHGGGDEIDSADAPNTEPGVWHHIAWSNDKVEGAAGSGAQKIFVDGALVTGPDATALASAIDANLTEFLLIGTSVSGGSFSGAIDDVRVYNGLLSSAALAEVVAEATRAPGVGEGLLIHYTFDPEPLGDLAADAEVTNLGAGGTNGLAVVPSGTMTIKNDAGRVNGAEGTFGNYIDLQPAGDDLEGDAATHINSGRTLRELGLGGADNYTMMAWVKFENQTADNMVFGGSSGDVIHLGGRGANYWSGHWGDDVNSGGNPETETGAWHHVTWTNTAETQEQEIYVDGSSTVIGGSDAAGGFSNNLDEQLLVGTSRNAGSFRGALDDVRVYDAVLTPEEITEAMNDGNASTDKLRFTRVTHDSANDMITVEFTSIPTKTYSLLWTPDLQDGPDYIEIEDSIDAHPTDPTTTLTIPTPTPFPNPDNIIPNRVFLIMRENPPPPPE